MNHEIYYVGDVHGLSNLRDSVAKITRSPKQDTMTHIIYVGDIGLGFNILQNEYEFFKEIDLHLRYFMNVKLYLIRGNHDNPEYWNPKSKEYKLFKKLKSLVLLKDWSTKTIAGKKHLFYGGGISIDRTNRTKDISYWEDESINPIPMKTIKQKLRGVDIVVSHVPPVETFGYSKLSDSPFGHWLKKDANLQKDLDEENEFVESTFKLFKNKVIYYGHMHDFRKIELEDVNVTAYMLRDYDWKNTRTKEGESYVKG